jgi:hypothetical protein
MGGRIGCDSGTIRVLLRKAGSGAAADGNDGGHFVRKVTLDGAPMASRVLLEDRTPTLNQVNLKRERLGT